jgi:hypothetical protein
VLKYPLFGSEGADEFQNIDLRTSQNYAWSLESSNPGEKNTFVREEFCRDLQRETGRPYTRTRYYHLYLNGQYWGLYETQERSEASYAATYFGGQEEDYDVVMTDGYQTSYTDGTIDERDRHLRHGEAGTERPVGRLDLEGVSAGGHRLQVDRLQHAAPEALEAAGQVAHTDAEQRARVE